MIYKDSANLELQQLYQYMKKEFKSIVYSFCKFSIVLFNSSTIIFTHSSASLSNLKESLADTSNPSKISLTATVPATSIPLFARILFTQPLGHPLTATIGYFLSISSFFPSMSAEVEPMQMDITFSFSFLQSPTATRDTNPFGLMPLHGAKAILSTIISPWKIFIIV